MYPNAYQRTSHPEKKTGPQSIVDCSPVFLFRILNFEFLILNLKQS